MSGRPFPPRRALGTLALAGAAVAAFGGATSASAPASPPADVTAIHTAAPDHLDPALGYTVAAAEALWVAYTPLLTYPHVAGPAGSRLIPGLATSLPEVSDGGRTYRLTMRSGLRYTDGRPVLAGDVAHSIKRVLRLRSGASPFFLGIEGAAAYLRSKDPTAPISGITADDATGAITFHLTRPQATFANVLAMTFAAPVPQDTPFREMTLTPPPGVGAFRIAEVSPTATGFTMIRNDGFSIPGLPTARLARIRVTTDNDTARATRAVLRGSADMLDDVPATSLLSQVRRTKRFKVTPAASVNYIYLNHRLAPFDDVRVRRAVGMAIDDRAILRTIGGFGELTCNFLPPAMPGYRRISPCPFGAPSRAPLVGRARALVRAAGATGARVEVWNSDSSPFREQGREVVRDLNRIGLRARARLLPPDSFFTRIASPSSNAQLVMSGWIQDFPHPADFFLLVDGKAIARTNNQNVGEVDDPVLTRGIARLSRFSDLARVTAQWARLDRRVIEQAHVIPNGGQYLSVLGSPRMDVRSCALIHPVFANDYTSWCLRS